MGTESGLEEFILLVNGMYVKLVRRSDGTAGHVRYNPNVQSFLNLGWKLVKVYLELGASEQWNECAVYTEIGYCEQRLTALERLRARCYAGHYWDIPF